MSIFFLNGAVMVRKVLEQHSCTLVFIRQREKLDGVQALDSSSHCLMERADSRANLNYCHGMEQVHVTIT